MEFAAQLEAYRAEVEAGLQSHLPRASTPPGRLHEAMRYSLEAGGKRIRPVLLLAAADLFQAPPHSAIAAAVAVECIHTYSLIHDDLPCMDNDDLRRGRPTAHKQFDEATALLAGDALLTHAFWQLAASYGDRPEIAARLLFQLGWAAGSQRLIGGQMEDLLAEKKTGVTPEELRSIHLKKTAAMISAPLAMGGIIGGATPKQVEALHDVGENLGLAFQIMDDVLDATADTATLGKTAGKDLAADKTTYVKLHGLETSRTIAQKYTSAALAALAALPAGDGFLKILVESLATRGK